MIIFSHFLKISHTFLQTISVNLEIVKMDNNLLKEKEAQYTSKHFILKHIYRNISPHEDITQFMTISKLRFEVG